MADASEFEQWWAEWSAVKDDPAESPALREARRHLVDSAKAVARAAWDAGVAAAVRSFATAVKVTVAEQRTGK